MLKIKNLFWRILLTIVLLLALTVSLGGCAWFSDWKVNLEETASGLPYTIQTFDFNGHNIDKIMAKSAYIHNDDDMSKIDNDGNELSSVIDVDYGNKRMIHVGSTLIAYEGLTNYMTKFNRHNKIDDNDRSFTLANRIYQDFKNDFNPDSKVVFIKSQSGYPIGTFVGKSVRISQTDMNNATKFNIDGHRLFVYRCNYTVYPVASLK